MGIQKMNVKATTQIDPRKVKASAAASALLVLLTLLLIHFVGQSRGPSPVKTLDCSRQGSLSFAWSPDGEKLACAGDGGAIDVYDTTTWRSTGHFEGHEGWIAEIAWDLQGNRIASLGLTDNTVVIWDVSNARLMRSIKVDVLGVVGTASGASLIWDAEGSRLAVIPVRFGAIHVLDVASGYILAFFPEAESASWNSTRNTLAMARDNAVQVMDVATGSDVAVYRDCDTEISFVGYSPDGNDLAALCGKDIYLPTMGKRLAHPRAVERMAWSPDGQRIASVTADKTYIWDLANSQVLNTLDIYNTPDSGLGEPLWSMDGNRLAVSGGQSIPEESFGKVWIWDVTREEMLYEIDTVSPRPPIAWSPKGDMLAVEDRDLLIYSISEP